MGINKFKSPFIIPYIIIKLTTYNNKYELHNSSETGNAGNLQWVNEQLHCSWIHGQVRYMMQVLEV